ncbi:hypothetical protein VF10_19365, partial [Nostoc linckia z13]
MVDEVAANDPRRDRHLRIEAEIVDALGREVHLREPGEKGPVDDDVVLEHDCLGDAVLDHVAPDREVARIAADLARGEGAALVAVDGFSVERQSGYQAGRRVDERPGN